MKEFKLDVVRGFRKDVQTVEFNKLHASSTRVQPIVSQTQNGLESFIVDRCSYAMRYGLTYMHVSRAASVSPPLMRVLSAFIKRERFYKVSSYNENGHVVAPVTAVAQQRRSLSFSHLHLYERSGTLRAVTLCPSSLCTNVVWSWNLCKKVRSGCVLLHFKVCGSRRDKPCKCLLFN